MKHAEKLLALREQEATCDSEDGYVSILCHYCTRRTWFCILDGKIKLVYMRLEISGIGMLEV